MKHNNQPDENLAPLLKISFSVTTPGGDLRLDQKDLQVKLEGCPLGATYGEYFSAIQEVLEEHASPIMQGILRHRGAQGLPRTIHVRAEKHGALCHPAGLELTWPEGGASRYALLVAVSPEGREALRRETHVLEHLQDAFEHRYLPEKLVFVAHSRMSFLLAPWFSGFHEFHVRPDGDFSLWDYEQGIRNILGEHVRKIFFQAARILTLYTDPRDGSCIHPWSHAAGDFIVHLDGQGVDVRLTTARGYGPRTETNNMLSALFAFFLDLCLRMRLDRVDGVGEWVWLERDVLESAAGGFFAAVGERSGDGGQALRQLARILPSFSSQELLDGHEAILGDFSVEELAVILPRLEKHCQDAVRALKQFALRVPPETSGNSGGRGTGP